MLRGNSVSKYNMENEEFETNSLESIMSDYLERDLEKIVFGYLKNFDIEAIIQRVLISNQQQILTQALKSIGSEIFDHNTSGNINYGSNKIADSVANAIYSAISKYI